MKSQQRCKNSFFVEDTLFSLMFRVISSNFYEIEVLFQSEKKGNQKRRFGAKPNLAIRYYQWWSENKKKYR